MVHITHRIEQRDVTLLPLDLSGVLNLPYAATGLVVFVHGSGSSRFSPRNNAVARALNEHGFATLLFDLLTEQEQGDRTKVFNISLLTARLVAVIEWIDTVPELNALPLGLFGASTGAAAALAAAAHLKGRVSAVVSRGGRPDLAQAVLPEVNTPTLLLVGGDDTDVLALNEQALTRLAGAKALEVIAGASHLFPEPGAMAMVVEYATRWFGHYLVNTENPGNDSPVNEASGKSIEPPGNIR